MKTARICRCALVVALLLLAFCVGSADAAPTVDNATGPTSDSPTTATLYGQVVATNEAAPSIVRIYFGDNDGETMPSNWDTNYVISTWTEGVAFSTNVTGLLFGKTYYYRVYALNTGGESWSTVTNFTTLATTTWSPSDIASLKFWLDADDASTITLNGSTVSQWNDKSSHGRHVSQSDSGSQPGYASSTISFDGTADYLWNSSPFMYANGQIDLFLVGAVNNTQDDRIVAEGRSTSVTPIYAPAQTHNSGDYSQMSVYIRNDANAILLTQTPLSATGAFNNSTKLYQWRDTGSSMSGRVNGGTETVANYTQSGSMTLDRFAVGALLRGTPAVYADCDIREIVITDNLSNDDRESMEGYLAWKWGLEGNLPIGHSYTNSEPRTVLPLGITNTAAANITTNAADLVGTLDATNSVFTVHAYWSTNSYAGAAAWTNAVTGGTASSMEFGTYTNVTGQSVTGSVSGLLSGTVHYYTWMATNAATNIWASPNKSFETEIGVGQIAIETANADNISNVTTRLNATLACPGTNATVIAYWWQTGSGTTNSFTNAPYSNITSSNVSHTATGLSPQTSYRFTFRATNATDDVWADSTNTFTTHDIPEVGNGAGPVLSWQALTGWTAVTLNGEIVATNGVPLTNVRIYFGDNNPGAGTAVGWDVTDDFPAVTGVESFSTNLTGLDYETTYYYTVQASNAYGSAWSPVTSFTTPRQLWIPTNLAAEAWYDAADETTIALSSGQVSQWDDVSENVNHATQGTPASRPSAGGDIGGFNALFFDGSNDRLNTTLTQLTNCTILIVASPLMKGVNQTSLILATSTAWDSGGLYLETENYATGAARHNVNYGAAIPNSQKSYNGGVGVAPSVFQAGIFAHWGSGFSTDLVTKNYRIGNRDDNWNAGHYKGTIGEIIIIPSVLSDDDRQKVEGYLAHKWGLENELPDGHPYKNDPPYPPGLSGSIFRFR